MDHNYRESTELLPGLPEEVTLECLTQLHHSSHRLASQVCRRWRGLIRSTDFYYLRKQTGRTRVVVCLVQSLPIQSEPGDSKPMQQPVYGISVFDPVSWSWDRLEQIPQYTTLGLPLFCQVASAEGKLIVMGGWDPTSWDPVKDVFLYDFTTRKWTQCQDMPFGRSFFAASATEGKVYVAGGHDESKNALKSAWVYDIRNDEWSELPQMSEERDECEGHVIGSEFWVVSGYDTESQGRFKSSAEVYNMESGQWRRVENSWTENQCPRSCVGVSRDGRVACVAESDPEVRIGTCGIDIGDRTLVTGSAYQGATLEFYLTGPKNEEQNGKSMKIDVSEDFSGFVQTGCSVEI